MLVACEYSGRVREAFRARGHDAWSCDMLPAEDGSPHHIRGDAILWAMNGHPINPWLGEPGPEWDLMVAHPPCTHLSVSGARHFEEKRADGRQQEAIAFFMALTNAPIPRIAIENPVCIMSSVWREPDQIVQPWNFGEFESKATCFWLKGLAPMRVMYESAEACRVALGLPEGEKPKQRVHLMPPGPDRWKERSRTYEGIADAMAEQWGSYSDLVTQMEAAA